MIINSNIQTKEDIIQGLEDVWQRCIVHCQNQDDALFEKPTKPGKWSTAQNIEHLCTSTFPITKGMNMPKMMMKFTFGTCNRAEKTIDELYAKYKTALARGQKSPPKFDPPAISNVQKLALLDKFGYAKEKLLTVLDHWNEKALSKYILPHPAIGKLTVREMLMFTIFHTEHHLNIIKAMDT